MTLQEPKRGRPRSEEGAAGMYVTLPPELVKRVRTYAKEHELALKVVVKQALERYLEANEHA